MFPLIDILKKTKLLYYMSENNGKKVVRAVHKYSSLFQVCKGCVNPNNSFECSY